MTQSMLWPEEVRRVQKVVDELDELFHAYKEILGCLDRGATVEWLQEQINAYGPDEQDELYHTMVKLVRDLKVRR